MNVNTKSLCVLIVFFLSLLLPAWAGEDDPQLKIFHFKGQSYRVESRTLGCQADIILSGDIQENLSRDYPGDNIFPMPHVRGKRFYISWIQHDKDDIKLFLYDASLGTVRPLVQDGFNFINHETGLIFNREGQAKAMVFRGNNSHNDDLFLVDLGTGDIKKISSTQESEKEWTSSETPQGITLETRTLTREYGYFIDRNNLEVELLWDREIIRELPDSEIFQDVGPLNTILAFGDSITWGKMRMNDLPEDLTGQYHHPELAFPQKIQEHLTSQYGTVHVENLGVPGEGSYGGAQRIDETLALYDANYFIFMLGTNDVWSNQFSLDSTMENLRYVADAALARNMRVVVSTIPPRADRFNIPRVTLNMENLNAAIISMAINKEIKYIDTYTAFMNYLPPMGWLSLLEDRGAQYYLTGEQGQHPSPLGHTMITELFIPQILDFPPNRMGLINIRNTSSNFIRIRWPRNEEFDLDHYRIEFGYFPGELTHSVTSTTTYFNFIHPPYLLTRRTKIYFRGRVVDAVGQMGEATAVYTAEFE